MASSSTANDDNDYDDLLDLLVQTWDAPPPDPRLQAIADICAKIKREDRSRSPADHADHTVVDDESTVPDEPTVVDESGVSKKVAYELNRIANYVCIITDHFLDGKLLINRLSGYYVAFVFCLVSVCLVLVLFYRCYLCVDA